MSGNRVGIKRGFEAVRLTSEVFKQLGSPHSARPRRVNVGFFKQVPLTRVGIKLRLSAMSPAHDINTSVLNTYMNE